jgi:hypothetical protein
MHHAAAAFGTVCWEGRWEVTLVDRHIGKRLVSYSFSPPPPKPQVIIQEVVRKPEPIPESVKEHVAHQDEEIARLTRDIELLTIALKRQTAEPKRTAALYLGRRVKE